MGSLGEWLQLVIGAVGTFLSVGVFVMIWRLHARTPNDIGSDGSLTPAASSNARFRQRFLRVEGILLGGCGGTLLLVVALIGPLGGSKSLQVVVFLAGSAVAILTMIFVEIRADRRGRANRPGA